MRRQMSPTPITPPTLTQLIVPWRLNFDNVSPPRVVVQQQNPPQCPLGSPIAHRTRSRAPLPAPLVGPKVTPLALNVNAGRYHQRGHYRMPTTKAVQTQDKQLEFAGICQAMDSNNVDRFCLSLPCVTGLGHTFGSVSPGPSYWQIPGASPTTSRPPLQDNVG